jgi:hypothetical protein
MKAFEQSPREWLTIGTMRVIVAILLAACVACAFAQTGVRVKVSAQYYRVKATIDTVSIKALGSAQTKATPCILQVDKKEADRVAALVTKGGGSLVGSPTAVTLMNMAAKVSTDSDGDGYSMDVTPSSKGSDTITLNFKLTLTNIMGTKKQTRSASGFARLQESKYLLVIVNPRNGQGGFMGILHVARQK